MSQVIPNRFLAPLSDLEQIFLSTAPPEVVLASYASFLRRRSAAITNIRSAITECFTDSVTNENAVSEIITHNSLINNQRVIGDKYATNINTIITACKSYLDPNSSDIPDDAVDINIEAIDLTTSSKVLVPLSVILEDIAQMQDMFTYTASLLETSSHQVQDGANSILNLSDAIVGMDTTRISEYVESTKQCLRQMQSTSDVLEFIRAVFFNITTESTIDELTAQPLMPNGQLAQTNPVKSYFCDGYVLQDLSNPFQVVADVAMAIGDVAVNAITKIVTPIVNVVKKGVKKVVATMEGTYASVNDSPYVDGFGAGNAYVRLRMNVSNVSSAIGNWGIPSSDITNWAVEACQDGTKIRHYGLPCGDIIMFVSHEPSGTFVNFDIHFSGHSYSNNWIASGNLPKQLGPFVDFIRDSNYSTKDMVFPSESLKDRYEWCHNIAGARALLSTLVLLATWDKAINAQHIIEGVWSSGGDNAAYWFSDRLPAMWNIQSDGTFLPYDPENTGASEEDFNCAPFRLGGGVVSPDDGTVNQYTAYPLYFGANGDFYAHGNVHGGSTADDILRYKTRLFENLLVMFYRFDTELEYIPYTSSYNWSNTSFSICTQDDIVQQLKSMSTKIFAVATVVVGGIIVLKKFIPQLRNYATLRAAEYKAAEMQYTAAVVDGTATAADAQALRRAGRVTRLINRFLPALAGYATSGIINATGSSGDSVLVSLPSMIDKITKNGDGITSTDQKLNDLKDTTTSIRRLINA